MLHGQGGRLKRALIHRAGRLLRRLCGWRIGDKTVLQGQGGQPKRA
ncbi:MAG: hypothetical protein HFH94_05860 [Lachnospiraceae bacterium]|nr:hypothetical protein [uncultured Acetatifactor sp.]MCI9219246.1 hypothetical protein [Lachnospiraceae bacterium]